MTFATGPNTSSSVQCLSMAGVGWIPITETIKAHDVFHHPSGLALSLIIRGRVGRTVGTKLLNCSRAQFQSLELSAPLTASQVQFHCNSPNEVWTAAGWSTGLCCSTVSLPTLVPPWPSDGGLCPNTGHQASTSLRLKTCIVLKLFQFLWGGEV